MRILQYKGRSAISKAIRWQTRSIYSHSAIELDDGSVIEAWHVGGVSHVENFRVNHSPGTVVDVFHINVEYDENKATEFLLAQVGKKYDYGAILRFISRRNEPHDQRWFCSELTLSAIPVLLSRLPPSHCAPRDIGISPGLDLLFSWVT